MPRRLPEEKRECVVNLLRMGKRYREIAEVCGVSLSTVSRIAKEEGIDVGARHSTEELGVAAGSVVTGDRSTTTVEEDVRLIANMVKQKLDPKHPLMNKLVVDLSWWMHLIIDFSKLVLPDVFRMMGPGEVDLGNPEVTARNAAKRFREALEKLKEVAEARKRVEELEARIKLLEEENTKLKELVEEYKRLYDEALEETKRMITDLRGRVSRTLAFFIREVPRALPAEARAVYIHVAVPFVKRVWGETQ